VPFVARRKEGKSVQYLMSGELLSKKGITPTHGDTSRERGGGGERKSDRATVSSAEGEEKIGVGKAGKTSSVALNWGGEGEEFPLKNLRKKKGRREGTVLCPIVKKGKEKGKRKGYGF